MEVRKVLEAQAGGFALGHCVISLLWGFFDGRIFPDFPLLDEKVDDKFDCVNPDSSVGKPHKRDQTARSWKWDFTTSRWTKSWDFEEGLMPRFNYIYMYQT